MTISFSSISSFMVLRKGKQLLFHSGIKWSWISCVHVVALPRQRIFAVHQVEPFSCCSAGGLFESSSCACRVQHVFKVEFTMNGILSRLRCFESVRVNRALQKMHFPSLLLLAPAFSHDNCCLGYLYGCVCVCVFKWTLTLCLCLGFVILWSIQSTLVWIH